MPARARQSGHVLAAWTAALHLRQDPTLVDVIEHACHEGNCAMRNILSAARAEEAGAAVK